MSPCLRQFIIFFVLFVLGSVSLLLLTKDNAQAVEFLPTTVTVKLECGDGFAEHSSGEVCDPGEPPGIPPDLGTTTCADYNDVFSNPFVSGDMDCQLDCADFDISGCYTCGNTSKEDAEECDASDFGGATCITLGYESGTLTCLSDCRINIADCVPMPSEPGTPGSGSSGGAVGGSSGFSPGSKNEDSTKVVAIGKAYPHSDVHILIDGVVAGIVETDAKADFYFETTEISPGVASFGFWSEDNDGLKSVLLTLTFRIISGAVTTISGVYLSPSIDIDNNAVRQGEDIRIYGQTVPNTEVHVHINSAEEIIKQTQSAETGKWELVFNTTPLDEDFHTAKALFQVETAGNIIQSGFSRSISFHVGKVGGEVPCPEGDLNHDGRVNLTDFSILLYWWGTDNACADQNQNGIVDLVDFSIMMYYWTG